MSGSAVLLLVGTILICGIALRTLAGIGINAVRRPFTVKGAICVLLLVGICVYFIPEVIEAMSRIH